MQAKRWCGGRTATYACPLSSLKQGAKAPCADAGVEPCGKGVLGLAVAWL